MNWPSEPYLDLGDAVQVRHHLLKAQLDFLEQAQQRRRVAVRQSEVRSPEVRCQEYGDCLRA